MNDEELGRAEAEQRGDGMECTCGAYSYAECGCGADWTPSEVYRLRDELARQAATIAELQRWKDAIIDAAVVNWTLSGDDETNPRGAVNELICHALDLERHELREQVKSLTQERDAARAERDARPAYIYCHPCGYLSRSMVCAKHGGMCNQKFKELMAERDAALAKCRESLADQSHSNTLQVTTETCDGRSEEAQR